jgi:DNA polymerase-1
MQVDLSQIEWRAAAWLAQDQEMIREINGGVDQHVATVRELMELSFVDKSDKQSKENRNHAKIFNFRMIYGGSEWGFFLDVNMPSFTIAKWRRIIANFFAKYNGLKKLQDDNWKHVIRHGELHLPTGRWFKFHKAQIKDTMFTYRVNQTKNFIVQGISGGDFLPLMGVVIRRGMKAMGLKSKLILTVHDSILFDYADDERDRLAKLCYDVGNNLDKYIRAYFGIDWNVKLEVEVEAGRTYGDLNYLSPEEVKHV